MRATSPNEELNTILRGGHKNQKCLQDPAFFFLFEVFSRSVLGTVIYLPQAGKVPVLVVSEDFSSDRQSVSTVSPASLLPSHLPAHVADRRRVKVARRILQDVLHHDPH